MVKRTKTNSAKDRLKKKFNKNSKSHASTNPDRPMPKAEDGQKFYRTKAKIKLLNLYNQKKPDMYFIILICIFIIF